MKLLLIFIFFIVRIDAIPITIPPGSNARWVSEHLKQKKIINSSRLFYLYLRTNNLSTQLHSGDFDIPQDAPYKEISDILIGKKQHYVSVTIPEGYTMQEIANTLVDKKIIKDAATFLNHVSNQPPSKIIDLQTQPYHHLRASCFLTLIILQNTHRIQWFTTHL
jgi:cell division protein YceG involved in septum cleavage